MNPQDFKVFLDQLKKLNDNFTRLNASVSSLKDISFDLRSIASSLEERRRKDGKNDTISSDLLGCGCKKKNCTCDPEIVWPPVMCKNCSGDFEKEKK